MVKRYLITFLVFIVVAHLWTHYAKAQCKQWMKIEAIKQVDPKTRFPEVVLKFRDKSLLASTKSLQKNSLEARISQMSTALRPVMVNSVAINLTRSDPYIKFSVVEGLTDWEIRDSLQLLFWSEGVIERGVCVDWRGAYTPPPKKEKKNGN